MTFKLSPWRPSLIVNNLISMNINTNYIYIHKSTLYIHLWISCMLYYYGKIFDFQMWANSKPRFKTTLGHDGSIYVKKTRGEIFASGAFYVLAKVENECAPWSSPEIKFMNLSCGLEMTTRLVVDSRVTPTLMEFIHNIPPTEGFAHFFSSL
jgi:hypothetical protein